jgi:hypothetical protein
MRRRAYAIVEILIAATLVALLAASATQMTISLNKSFERTHAQLGVDQVAGLTIQRLTRDLQEAKQVDVLSSTSLKIYFPIVNPDGTYNRKVRDDVNTIEYYRGDRNGDPNPKGPAVVRLVAGEAPDVVCEGTENLLFESTNPSSVDVTLAVVQNTRGRPAESHMIHRAIFLRNY